MEGRRMMLAGGAITAAATAAVGGVVAVSSATALADRPGRALAVAPIVVPAPAATPVLSPIPAAAPIPQIVPAPAPEDVSAPPVTTPAPPAPGSAAPATDVPDFGVDAVVGVQRAREWAAAQGWNEARIESWVAEMQARYNVDPDSLPQTPVDTTGTESVPESPSSRIGSKREQLPDISLPGD